MYIRDIQKIAFDYKASFGDFRYPMRCTVKSVGCLKVSIHSKDTFIKYNHSTQTLYSTYRNSLCGSFILTIY